MIDAIVSTMFYLKRCLLATMVVACAPGVAFCQPIFMDDFENGTVDAPIGLPWRTQASATGMAVYASTNNPFSPGSIYARFNDQSGSGSGIRLVSSNSADTDMTQQHITGHVTTYSFDFWEPVDTGGADTGGLLFAYSNNNELNSTGRNFGASLLNGVLQPQNLVAGSGAATSYSLETVNTVFMIANDTASTLVDYQPGRTLQPAQADLWISLDGAAPVFAFSVGKQNATTNPRGIGFRSFGADLEEAWVNNVLLMPGATFDRTIFPGACALGDVNCDDVIDLENDFETIRLNFRRSPRTRAQGDLTGDSFVDFDDFIEWKGAFLSGGGSLAGLNLDFGATVPEPASVGIAAVAALSLIGCRWRRCKS